MKRLFSILAISGLLMFGTAQAQESDTTQTSEPAVEAAAVETTPADAALAEDTVESTERSFTQELKVRFIEGGPGFMGIVLLCLILGLAISIERIIYLNFSTTNSK